MEKRVVFGTWILSVVLYIILIVATKSVVLAAVFGVVLSAVILFFVLYDPNSEGEREQQELLQSQLDDSLLRLVKFNANFSDQLNVPAYEETTPSLKELSVLDKHHFLSQVITSCERGLEVVLKDRANLKGQLLSEIATSKDYEENIANALKIIDGVIAKTERMPKVIQEVTDSSRIVLEESAGFIQESTTYEIDTARINSLMRECFSQFEITETVTSEFSGSVTAFESITTAIVDATFDFMELTTQINVIAINASIEAAHLGGQGKVFTVIAREIKGFSDRLTRLTSRIEKHSVSLENMIVAMKSTETGTRENIDISQGFELFAERLDGLGCDIVNMERKTVDSDTALQAIFSALQELEASVVEMGKESDILKKTLLSSGFGESEIVDGFNSKFPDNDTQVMEFFRKHVKFESS